MPTQEQPGRPQEPISFMDSSPNTNQRQSPSPLISGRISSTPVEIQIRPRQQHFDFHQVPHNWLKNLATSHFMNAVSVLIPESERIVIRTLRDHQNNIQDQELKTAVQGLVKQEALHAAAHRQSNRVMAARYPAVKYFERWQVIVMSWLGKRIKPLSIPVAFEHFTSALAKSVLAQPESWTGGKDNVATQFLLWHAFDELEHQSVCLDIYRNSLTPRADVEAQGPLTQTIQAAESVPVSNYLSLALLLLWVPMMVVSTYGIQIYLLTKDGAWKKRRHWSDWAGCLKMTLPILCRGIWRYRRLHLCQWQADDLALYQRSALNYSRH